MTTTGVRTGSVGAEGDNDERDVKLVQRLLDDWLAREAGEPAGRPLPVDGRVGPRTLAALRAFQARHPAGTAGRIESDDPTWDALAAFHLAGIRGGRVRAERLAFVPLPPPGGRSRSEADWREAFAVHLRRLREWLRALRIALRLRRRPPVPAPFARSGRRVAG